MTTWENLKPVKVARKTARFRESTQWEQLNTGLTFEPLAAFDLSGDEQNDGTTAEDGPGPEPGLGATWCAPQPLHVDRLVFLQTSKKVI